MTPDEAPQPAANIQSRMLKLAPYFAQQRSIWAVAIGATVVAAMTEPLIPALFKPLLDQGFTGKGLPLWFIPVAVIGLFAIRGITFFLAQYALARVTNDGMEKLRTDLFTQLRPNT